VLALCPKCGAQVASGASFCLICGTSLKTTGPPTTSQASMKEKGGVLEDSIADYFRRMGFDVHPRVKMRDRFDVSHEIDVLASKKEDFGTIHVAVECKYVAAPIDIKEVRNFHDKLSALGITKGVFASTGGFTTDAESHAGALGIELWDMKTIQDKMAKLETPQKDVIHDALPVNPTVISALSPRHLRNFRLFSETIRLNYRPYYFVDYHCFSQHTVAGNSILLDRRGHRSNCRFQDIHRQGTSTNKDGSIHWMHKHTASDDNKRQPASTTSLAGDRSRSRLPPSKRCSQNRTCQKPFI